MKYWIILLLAIGGSSACKTNREILYISPQKQDCIGVAPMKCYLVKKQADQQEWEFFYNEIQGFDFEPGYNYKIKVSVKDLEHVPADASSKQYSLIKLLEKKKSAL